MALWEPESRTYTPPAVSYTPADQPVAIDAAPEEQPIEPVSIDSTGVTTPVLSPEVITRRALTGHFGLNDKLDIKYEDMYRAISTGQENELRQQVAAQLDEKNAFNHQAKLMKIAGSDASAVDLLSAAQRPKPVDPYTVFEENFARRFIEQSYANPQGNFADAIKDIPEVVTQANEMASRILTKHQFFLSESERIKEVYQQQGWGPFLVDLSKFLLPFYQRYMVAGSVPGVDSGLIGNYVEEMAKQLALMPIEELREKYPKILDEIARHNPTAALQLAQQVLGQNSDDVRLNNFFEILDVTSVAGLAAKGLKTANRVAQVYHTHRMVKDVLNAAMANRIDPPKVVANAAVGDLSEAATQRLVASVNETALGANPAVKEAIDALQSVTRTITDDMQARPGNLGQEIINRMSERGQQTMDKLFNLIEYIQKVERIPANLATEQALRAIQEYQKGFYPGIRNSIIDVGYPSWNRVMNTYDVEIQFGRPDGDYFWYKEAAEGYAEAYGLTKASREVIEPGFKTMQGSSYVIKPDGTTVRTKAPRSDHLGPSPAQAKDTTRLYRGSKSEAGWFTTDPEKIKGQGTPVYVDIPNDKFPKKFKLKDKTADEYYSKTKRTKTNQHPLDQGEKPQSARTFYIDPADVKKIKLKANSRFVDNGDGTFSVYHPNPKKGYEEFVKIPYSTTPEVGKTPVELFSPGMWKKSKSEAGAGDTAHLVTKDGSKVLKDPVTITGREKGPDGKFYVKFTSRETSTMTMWPEDQLEFVSRAGPTARAYSQSHFGSNISSLIRPSTTDIPGNYVIKQQGDRFYISVTRPLDENSMVVRDWLVATKDAQTPDSWMKAVSVWAGLIRNPDETLSMEQRMNRKVATYAPAAFLKLAKENMKDVQKLSNWTFRGTPRRKQYEQWKQAVLHAREEPDPITGDKGYFWQHPDQLEGWYLNTFGRMPSAREVGAYFSFVRHTEMDRVLRSIDLYKLMSRTGNEYHRISHLGLDGKRVNSAWFPGVKRMDLPMGSEDTTIILGAREGDEKIVRIPQMNPKERELLRDDVKNGKKQVIELWSSEARPLGNFSKKGEGMRVRYVITDAVQTRPLPFDMLPRRGGGHFDFDYEYYIKQAKIRQDVVGSSLTTWYEGDVTFAPVSGRRMGQVFAEKMNKVRQLLYEKKTAEAKQAALDMKLGIDFDEFVKMTKPTIGPNGEIIPPRIDLKEPFHVVKRGSGIIGLDKKALEGRYTNASGKSTLKDGTSGGSLARQYQLEYTGERDVFDMKALVDKGTEQNPMYHFEPAEFVDPITSMNRAMKRIVNSSFMDDYKIFSVEHWLKEFGDYLDPGDSDIWHSPFFHFENPVWREGIRNDQYDIVRKGMNARYQIKQLMGMLSPVDRALASMGSRLDDWAYGSKTKKAISVAPAWALENISDPATFLRAIPRHAMLGLWNFHQLWVQSQTYVNITAVAGARPAAAGTYAVLLNMWYRGSARMMANPRALDEFDKMASKLKLPGSWGWKPGEFKEATIALRNNGFDHVGTEYALDDRLMSPRVITHGAARVLDTGLMFFRGAERNVRRSAWYVAFKEFRQENPYTVLTNHDLNKILERADLLSVNMSRASNSMFQHGILSIPLQFATYQIRLAEQFTGKRLTGVEKLRLFAGQAMMYGIPVATGVTGLPLGDYIRRRGMEQGYIVGEKFWDTLMNEGIPSVMLAVITGIPDAMEKYQNGKLDLSSIIPHAAKTGNYYNIPGRYGSQGLEIIREIFRGDRSYFDILGGATFSVFKDTWLQSDGFIRAMHGFLDPWAKDNIHQATPEDFIDVVKAISSVNNLWRGYLAFTTGKWMSKKETNLGEVTKANAFFMSIFGLSPQSASDLNLLAWSTRIQKDVQKHVEGKFIEYYRRGLEAHRDKNHEQGAKYMSNALNYLLAGDYPSENVPALLSRAAEDQWDAIDNIDWSTYMRNVPDKYKEAYRDIYIRKQQLKGLREQ